MGGNVGPSNGTPGFDHSMRRFDLVRLAAKSTVLPAISTDVCRDGRDPDRDTHPAKEEE
jgi:hypothetical protein